MDFETEYNKDINSWNATAEIAAIDPNETPATPPHTHLHRSHTDMTWEDNSVDASEQTWNPGMPTTSNDAALAADMQAQELTNNFGGMDLNGDKGPRRNVPREYEPDPEPTMTSDEAWAALLAADQEKDLDDFKVFFLEYVRNNKELTFVDLEKKFRDEGLGVYLIALEKDIPQQKTIRNLQGETGKKYLVSFQLGSKNKRTRATKGQVAQSGEENLARLSDAGFLVEDLIPVCFNCGVKGHGRSECTEPLEERARTGPVISCINCGEEGHRMRDCTQERKVFSGDLTCRICDQPGHMSRECPNRTSGCRNCGEEGHNSKECDKPLTEEFLSTIVCRRCGESGHLGADCPEKPKFVCNNCGQEGHKRSECTEPPNLDNVQCKECEQTGHFARDCPNKKCRNCEKPGHSSRDCPEPRNPKNVECRNCLQMGHFSRDCPEPRADTGRVCYNCGSPDHMSRDCPAPRQGGPQGRRTERDTLAGGHVTSDIVPQWESTILAPVEDSSGNW